MKIEIDLELLSLIDRRALTLNQLPRKKKKSLKKELASLVIQLANKEANQLFHNHIQDTYKDLIEEELWDLYSGLPNKTEHYV